MKDIPTSDKGTTTGKDAPRFAVGMAFASGAHEESETQTSTVKAASFSKVKIRKSRVCSLLMIMESAIRVKDHGENRERKYSG